MTKDYGAKRLKEKKGRMAIIRSGLAARRKEGSE